MNAKALLPSKHLRACDLDKPRLLTITKVGIAEDLDDPKPALFFSEISEDCVLNKTNINAVSEIYGEETDAWTGKKIVLYKARTEFQGKPVDCIRMRAPKNQPAAAPAAPAPSPAPAADLGIPEEQIPF